MPTPRQPQTHRVRCAVGGTRHEDQELHLSVPGDRRPETNKSISLQNYSKYITRVPGSCGAAYKQCL